MFQLKSFAMHPCTENHQQYIDLRLGLHSWPMSLQRTKSDYKYTVYLFFKLNFVGMNNKFNLNIISSPFKPIIS